MRFNRSLPAAIMLSFLTFGCGPALRSSGPNQQRQMYFSDVTNATGDTKSVTVDNGLKSINVPYTTAGGTDSFLKLQKSIATTSDKMTAKAVESVEVILLDKNGHRTNTQPVKFNLSVVFKASSQVEPKKLDFSADLALGGSALTAHVETSTPVKNAMSFTIDVTCHDLNCREIELVIHRHLRAANGALSPSVADVGILYRITAPHIRVKRTKDTAGASDPDLKGLGVIKDDQVAIRSTVAVVDGPSYSHLQVPDTSTPPAEHKMALDLRTDIVSTDETESQVSQVHVGENKNSLPGDLVGLNPETGDMTVNIKNGALIYVDESRPDTKKKPASKTVEKSIHIRADAHELIPYSAEQNKLPQASEVSFKLALHAADDEVQRLIRVWLGEEKDHGRCQSEANRAKLDKIIKYGPQVMQLVPRVTDKVDVTSDIAYILPLESSYAVDPSRPTDETPNAAGPKIAVGPWQIQYDTAVGVGVNGKFKLNIFPVVGGVPNDQDDRTYFYNATFIAARLFRELFAQFKTDPAMAIVAYRGSPSSANAFIRRMQKYQDFDVTLDDITRNQMQIKADCEYLNYTNTFLALRAIGQNLDLYDITPNPALDNNYKKRLKNPKGVLPNGL